MDEMTQCNYGSALLPKDRTICGVRLKPFCFGHLILLEETNNPLIAKDEIPVGYSEGVFRLYQALLVCALSYEDGLELLSNKDKWIREWKRFEKNLVKNMDIEKDWNILAKVNLFKNYMNYYLDLPAYEIIQGGSNSTSSKSGTDWKNAIKVIFKKLSYSESEILNMNMKQLFQEWTSYMECEGSIKVFNKFTADKLKEAAMKENKV